MKKIVVGVDFSKTSILALNYALGMARQTESALILVNVQRYLDYEVPLTAEERKGPRDVVDQLEALVKEHMDKVPMGIDYRVLEGSVHEELAHQARYSNAWLIVIGAHGLSGFQEFWMGKNSYRVVATSLCPVISVRKGYDVSRTLRRIVLPIDSTFETVQKVPFTLDIARTFKAEVHVLSLYSNSTPDSKMKVDASTHDAMRQIELADLKMVVEQAEPENITNAAIDYAVKVDADLISIMVEQEFAPRNILLGTYAHQMVNRSPIPVLTMHARVIVKSNLDV